MTKSEKLFRVNLVSGNPQNVLLAKYLKGDAEKRKGKDRVIKAIDAFYGSIALSQEDDVSRNRIQLAALENIAKLQHQIDYIRNYHRIINGIELTDRPENIPSEKIVANSMVELTDQLSPEEIDFSIFDN